MLNINIQQKKTTQHKHYYIGLSTFNAKSFSFPLCVQVYIYFSNGVHKYIEIFFRVLQLSIASEKIRKKNFLHCFILMTISWKCNGPYNIYKCLNWLMIMQKFSNLQFNIERIHRNNTTHIHKQYTHRSLFVVLPQKCVYSGCLVDGRVMLIDFLIGLTIIM